MQIALRDHIAVLESLGIYTTAMPVWYGFWDEDAECMYAELKSALGGRIP